MNTLRVGFGAIRSCRGIHGLSLDYSSASAVSSSVLTTELTSLSAVTASPVVFSTLGLTALGLTSFTSFF